MLEGDWAASFICAKHANLLSLAVTVAKYFCTSFRWQHMISCISLKKVGCHARISLDNCASTAVL